MKTRTLITAVAVASALALAACSGTSGTPQAGSAGGGETSAEQTAPTTGAGDQASAGSVGAASGTGDTGAGSASESSAQGGDGGESSAQGGDEDSSEGPTVTIGAGGLDGQTAHWFDVFCTGLSPLADLGQAMTSVDPSDPQAMQKSYVDLYNTLGDAFTTTANTLQGTPPPTFDQGTKVAGDLIKALNTMGPEMKSLAAQVAAADSSDMDAIDAAMAQGGEQMEKDMGTLDINSYELDSKTEAAVKAIPSCSAIGFDTIS